MICSKKDLHEYLMWDKCALGFPEDYSPKIFGDEILKFQIALRKYEYYLNIPNKTVFQIAGMLFYKYSYHNRSISLGFSIPPNIFDKGLSIAHYGAIVVNAHAKIGRNCRIQESVTIGSTGGSDDAPQIGDNVFIASGARIIGAVHIGNNVAIGANAVIVKSFEEDGVTLAGIPAKIVSQKGSSGFINARAKKC